MKPISGRLIVLEGSDGSGKTTQFKLLSERLKAAGYDVAVFDFPRYDKESSHFIKQYLNGRYGPASQVSPYTASLFYALDRYEAASDIRRELDKGKIVLVDRYVGSNMAHQGAKFDDDAEQRGFFVWEDNLEFQLLGIPRADANIFLRVPAKISYELIKNRPQHSYTKSVRDEHEADIDHLRKAVATYDLLCKLFPKDFSAIECTKDGRLMSVAQISNLIWSAIKPLLPTDKPHQGHSTIVKLSSAPAKNSVPAGVDDDKLTQDFKASSLFLKLAIERQLRSVEPSGLSTWSDYDYEFYTPMGFGKETEAAYKNSMEKLGGLHAQMRSDLEKYYERNLLGGSQELPSLNSLLLPVTPLAALTGFRVEMSPRSAQRIASNLLLSDSQELQWTAQQLYVAAKQKWPDSFKNPLESTSSPEPINNIIAKLAEDKLSLNSADKTNAKLLEATPRQEFDLLAESIYPYSSLSLDEISDEVSDWPYHQKYESFKQAVRDDSLLDKIRYKFDVVSDQLVLSQAASLANLEQLQIQAPSPRLGYEVPGSIELAGIDEVYLSCFDESLKLYSLLQQADRDDLTVYATLLGHKLRWQFTISAGGLRSLWQSASAGPLAGFVNGLIEVVAETHPLTWDALADPSGPDISKPAPRLNRVKPSRQRRPKSRRTPKSKGN